MTGASSADSFSSYTDALSWLYGLQRFGIKLGLENARRLFVVLQIDLSKAHVFHVAGTNGKGSVCAMIDSIGRAAGLRSGLFTSPHLVTFRERIQINGKMIEREEVLSGLEKLRQLVHTWDPHPTFFEIVTALALDHFARQRCDLIVLETGLGGRLDATNAVSSNISVLTPIALDHEKWLGSTIAEIAAEKAGIIKPNVPVVSTSQRAEAAKVIAARAAECNAPLRVVPSPYVASPVGLRGSHQKWNAATAVAAIRASDLTISEENIVAGLGTVQWPARFQIIDQRTVLDGAHNPASAAALAATWKETFGAKRATLILAVLADKDISGIVKALAPISGSVLLPKIRSDRSADPEEIAKAISSITPSLPCSITPTFGGALEVARGKADPILITGSLHFAGEVLAHLRGEPAAFEECDQ